MSVLEIRKFKDPVLRKSAKEVAAVDAALRGLIKDMAETAQKNGGIGLAANQVGVLKRVVLAQNGFKEYPPDGRCEPIFLALVNPKIIKKSKDKEYGEEGCLSFPGIFLNIGRAVEIEVEGLNEEGKEIKIKARGLLARILQHEIDHINGILFFKRLGFLERVKFRLTHFSIY